MFTYLSILIAFSGALVGFISTLKTETNPVKKKISYIAISITAIGFIISILLTYQNKQSAKNKEIENKQQRDTLMQMKVNIEILGSQLTETKTNLDSVQLIAKGLGNQLVSVYGNLENSNVKNKKELLGQIDSAITNVNMISDQTSVINLKIQETQDLTKNYITEFQNFMQTYIQENNSAIFSYIEKSDKYLNDTLQQKFDFLKNQIELKDKDMTLYLDKKFGTYYSELSKIDSLLKVIQNLTNQNVTVINKDSL
jgi:hypothetical protein